MIKIQIVSADNESNISRPKPIELGYSGFKRERALELANLIRIAVTDYKCFNNWVNNLNTIKIKNGVKSKEFTLEKDRKLARIDLAKNNTWIYAKKEIGHSTIKEYHLLTESDVKDDNLISQFSDNEYYKYKIIKTYEYTTYYPTKLEVDINRFGFIAERQESDQKISFVVFRGTRELGEWFSNTQFKQVSLLRTDNNPHGLKGYGKISLGFNKIYTGFRPGSLIKHENPNSILSQSHASFFRKNLERIDDDKIKYKYIYQAINEYISSGDFNSNTDVYIGGHSLGGALATIATMHIAKNNTFKTSINLYTFGSPKVGNNEFADKFNQLVDQNKIKAFRFVNSEDIITRVPMANWFKSGIELENNSLLELTRDAFNILNDSPKTRIPGTKFISRSSSKIVGTLLNRKSPTGGIFDEKYQHVGIPIYFTHQARRFNNQNLKIAKTIEDNHNITATYCGVLEKK